MLRRRLALALAAVWLVTAAVSGLLATPATGAIATAPGGVTTGLGGATATPPPPVQVAAGATYTFGKEPMDDVTYWAAQYQPTACGLTVNQLAAIMLAPTYPETGASGSAAPSPMTLSRWDTQSGLYAFGDKATTYPRAFWHPGVGAWAFDSAGGWNLTAAEAMNTSTAAQQAAQTMAQRWCGSSGTDAARRASVWGIWYGCNGGVCESIYNTIYDPVTLKVTLDPTVTRGGGTEARTCFVPTLGQVACTYVDPAKAQGYRAWNLPAWGPSPVSAPFYDFRANGREYRVWLRDDTGYGATVNANKAVTGNARTSLTWVLGDALCDLTANRGLCGSWSMLYLRNSTTSGVADATYPYFAPNGGRLLMCDTDGNGTDTPTKVVNGTWYVTDGTAGGLPGRTFGYGNSTDIPVCGDWNGDGIDTPGIVRNGVWYLTNTVGKPTADLTFGYGDVNDIPVVGDWDGNGTTTPGIVRNGVWYLVNTVGKPTADVAFGYGGPGDVPVVGDWNNDKVDSPGLKRANTWYLTNTVGKPTADVAFVYGDAGDTPVTGRWRVGAPATVAIVR
ncbi:MAG TPA: hypothetical protein VIJ47_11080 [Acidimicrobiales bacterium]